LTTRDDLVHSISKEELEIIKLKRRISELEDALSRKTLFTEPISIFSPDPIPKDRPGTMCKFRKSPHLFIGIRTYVIENINEWINIILEVGEVNTSLRILGQKIASFMGYLH